MADLRFEPGDFEILAPLPRWLFFMVSSLLESELRDQGCDCVSLVVPRSQVMALHGAVLTRP